MENVEHQPPSEDELKSLIEWLSRGLEPSVKKRAAVAAAEEALCRVQARQPVGTLDAETIADRAGAGGSGADGARRWINTQLPVDLFTNRLEQQKSWLRDRGQGATHAISLVEHRSPGGRGNRKTYEFVRVPIDDRNARSVDRLTSSSLDGAADSETEVERAMPVLATGRVSYDMAFCEPESMTRWARLIFRSGGVDKGSWRWKLLAGRFIFGVLFLGAMIAAAVVLPLFTKAALPWVFLVAFVAVVTFIYLTDIRPWVRIVDDRIRMAGDSLIEDFRPAQLEIWRDGERSTWRLVRYTASCPVCANTIEVLPGEPDFPRRLVGRCRESPREHVYSFDRVTRRGRALITPNMGF